MKRIEIKKIHVGMLTFLRGRFGLLRRRRNPVERLRYALKLDREEYFSPEIVSQRRVQG